MAIINSRRSHVDKDTTAASFGHLDLQSLRLASLFTAFALSSFTMASFLLNPTLILGLLVTRSLAVPAPSTEKSYVAKRATDVLSCWDNASNGKTFVAKNAAWEVVCGKDYV